MPDWQMLLETPGPQQEPGAAQAPGPWKGCVCGVLDPLCPISGLERRQASPSPSPGKENGRGTTCHWVTKGAHWVGGQHGQKN